MTKNFQFVDPTNGSTVNVRFRHRDKVKGRHPKSTECKIITSLHGIISTGVAKVTKEFPIIYPKGTVNEAFKIYGRRVKKVVKNDEVEIAIISADNFSYSQGRKIAFQKAIKVLDRPTRTLAWANFHKSEQGNGA